MAYPHSLTVLLDRDGTLIEDRRYLSDPADVVLLPGAVAGLRRLQAGGARLVLLTNQSGIARGILTPSLLEAVHRRLTAALEDAGVRLDGIYVCPHGPCDACTCRKPLTGLAERAAAELDFELSGSVVIGDKASDLELGLRLGVPAILVTTGNGPATLAAGTGAPAYVVDSLDQAATLLLQPGGLGPPE